MRNSMQIINNLQKLGGFITDLVFPVSCLVCGRDGAYLCNFCLSNLSRLEKQQCLVCQTPAPFGKTHPQCVTRNSVDGALSALNHKHKHVDEIVRVFKYNFVSSLANPLSELIVETIKSQGLENYFQDFLIVPIPLHQRRHNWRGFNQALLLAEPLAQRLNIPIDDKIVVRKKFTYPQVRLNADERKRNIENAFELTGNTVDKKILLIDDVITSGSTANELAKLLKRNKASEVWIISAAHG
jgi:competence protein ComFC